MTCRTSRLAKTIAAVLLGLPCAVATASDLDRAREYTDARDYAAALGIFERLHTATPDDSDLAIERARVLGYADRNADAAAAYAEVATRHPERRADVIASWAWQTLWAGRAEEAVPLFREALSVRPGDGATRVGLGQALLWSGQEPAAADEFDRALATNPQSRDARAGRALALNYSGRSREAARAYAELLPSTDAGLQLQAARAYYWAGFPDRAEPLLVGSPLPEAQHLRDFRVGREVAQCFASTSLDFASDADDLDTLVVAANAGWRIPGRGTLEAIVRDATYDGPDTSTWPYEHHRVDAQQALVAWSGRVGDVGSRYGVFWPMVALGGRDVDGWTALSWKARLRYAADDASALTLSAGNGVPETVGAARHHIEYTEVTVGLEARPAPRWRVGGNLSQIAYDGGNDRAQVSGTVDYLVTPRRQFRVGVDAVHFANSEPDGPTQPSLGYWNPERYSEARLFASFGGERGPWSYDARASVGYFSERDGWGTTTTDPTYAASGTVAYDFSPRLQLRAYAGGSSSGAGIGSGGEGYYRTYVGISLTGYFGAR